MQDQTNDIFSKRELKPKSSTKTKRDISLFRFFRRLTSNKILLNRMLMTVFIVFLVRVLAAIPLPGVNTAVLSEVFRGGSALENQYLFTLFTGGRLDSPSIIGLGLAAYINASIIMQLLPYVFKRLKELQKEGERGKQIINQITRFLTFPLAFIYGFAYLVLISQTDLGQEGGALPVGSFLIERAAGNSFPDVGLLLFMALILAAGTLLLMWLGEFITEKGIGNGASIIIMLGIIGSLPGYLVNDIRSADIGGVFEQLRSGEITALTANPNIWIVPIVIIGLILTIAAIIFVNESQREVKVQYARRVRETEQSASTTLPIKFTVTGVMPVIFAFSFMSVPQLVVPIIKNFAQDAGLISFLESIESSFLFASTTGIIDLNAFLYEALLFSLVVMFGLFYAFIVLNPKDTAENLQKSGGFIPGIRPGKTTETYFSTVLFRIGLVGSIFLASITLLPFFARVLISTFASPGSANLALLTGIGGTSLLILVSVFLDAKRQFNSYRVSNKYTSFAR